VPPKSAERNFKWRWGFAAVATAAAAAFCAWALVNNTYTIGNRAVAAVGALLATAALCAIGNAALLSYQVKAGTIPATNVDFRLRGLKAACMGADGRASTSKTGIVAWTGAVITALIYLLLLSRTVVGAGLFLGAVDQNWRPEYLVLLGLPAAAATVAAATVKHSNKDKGPLPADGTAPPGSYVRKKLTGNTFGLSKGLAELLTDDNGIIAWPDFQYMAFNLITLVYFISQVLSSPKNGLPAIPAALLTLMGVSATTYTANKTVETHPSGSAAGS